MRRLNVDVYEIYNSLQLPKAKKLSEQDPQILNTNRERIRKLVITEFMLKNILHMNTDRAICQYYEKQIADGKNKTFDCSL